MKRVLIVFCLLCGSLWIYAVKLSKQIQSVKVILPAVKPEYPVSGEGSYCPPDAMTLWYTAPVTAQTCANPWMDYALPIGNGQLGAMVYGGIHQDILQFNEKTLWEGSPVIRGAYQNFGNLYIEDTGKDLSSGVTHYSRQLDLENARASASWKDYDGSTTYSRQYIASYPDHCIAVLLKADRKGRINDKFYLWNPHGTKPQYAEGSGTFCGQLTTVSYNARFMVIPKGGKMTTDATGITVKGVDEVLVILAAATDYDPVAPGYISGTAGLALRVRSVVRSAAAKGWKALLGRQVSDYRSLYSRVHLDLDGGNNDLPTDQLISGYHRAVGPRKRLLEELYFQYGRYLLISSSRGIDLPNNLQGIWNDSDSPAWQCDMHADINVQMNYWPAEKTNLPEMHEKFLNYLYNMSLVQPQWRSYARDRAGQTTGWVNFTENNIFGHCTTWHNDYVEAGAWECAHLWQHYRYTQDRNFLRYRAMPVMLSCVRFWMQRLVRDPHDSLWVCPDEWSPEHGPVKSITAHAQQIVWNLFSNTIDAVSVLGINGSGMTASEFRQLKEKFAHLDNGLYTEIYRGTFGAERFGVHTGDTILREWKYTDYATGNYGESNHRHLSHLMALYPLDNLAPSSPFFRPAVNSIRLRGLQSQGWSMGWKMNLWARAQEGDSCQKIFNLAFRHSSDYVINMSSTAGGIYYNLLDAHSPFQIDGNFGVCAGMAEMLLQNQKNTILLLPALSSSWRMGRVDGLKAAGNFTIGMDWRNGALEKATVGSGSGMGCWLKYTDISRAVVKDEEGKLIKTIPHGPDMIFFPTRVGKVYVISMPSDLK